MAAETVLDLKSKYPQIKLILVYPCKNQTQFWKEDDIKKYNRIKTLVINMFLYQKNMIIYVCSKGTVTLLITVNIVFAI